MVHAIILQEQNWQSRFIGITVIRLIEDTPILELNFNE